MTDQLFDSLLFLNCARVTIKELVMMSKVDNYRDLAKYITNEASDYEIMYALIHEELPEKKFDSIQEKKVFEDFNKMTGFTDFVPISSYGMSSAKPILEFQLSNNILPQILQEVMMDLAQAKKELVKWTKALKDAEFPEEEADIQDHIKDLKGKIAELSKKSAETGAKTATGAKAATATKTATAAKTATATKTAAAGKTAAATKVAATTKAATGAATTTKVAAGTAGTGKVVAGAAGGGKAVAGSSGAAGLVGSQFVVGIGAAALAALAAYGAYKTYQRFFSKAAKACKGLSGKTKTMCMNKYKQQALVAQAADLKKGIGACKKNKDPKACQAAINNKIAKLNAKIAKLKSKIS